MDISMGRSQDHPAEGSTIYSLQYLRAVAATLVLLTHTFQVVAKNGRLDIAQSFNLGNFGVDLFFVISGFIMFHITQFKETSAEEFLKQRLFRVVPPYWIVTFLMGAATLFVPHAFNSSRFEPANFIASLFMFAWPNAVWHDAVPIFFPGWTLNYEVFFYAIFALALIVKTLSLRLLLVSGIIITLVAAGLILKPVNTVVSFYLRPIMIEFIFGTILSFVFIRLSIKPAIGVIVIVASLGLLIWSEKSGHQITRADNLRGVVWGLPALGIVGATLLFEKQGMIGKYSLFRRLGDASYATYLVHFFLVGMIGQFWKAAHLSQRLSDGFLILACVLTCWVLGIAFHKLIEKPLVTALKNGVTAKIAHSSASF